MVVYIIVILAKRQTPITESDSNEQRVTWVGTLDVFVFVHVAPRILAANIGRHVGSQKTAERSTTKIMAKNGLGSSELLYSKNFASDFYFTGGRSSRWYVSNIIIFVR